MIIKRIVLINRAPFEKLDLDFTGKSVISLTGINGAGKTTILSYIEDALYEMAKKAYGNEFYGEKLGKYYRIASSRYRINANKGSLVCIIFEDGGDEIKYIDYYGENDAKKYEETIKDAGIDIPYSKISSEIIQNNI